MMKPFISEIKRKGLCPDKELIELRIENITASEQRLIQEKEVICDTIANLNKEKEGWKNILESVYSVDVECYEEDEKWTRQ